MMEIPEEDYLFKAVISLGSLFGVIAFLIIEEKDSWWNIIFLIPFVYFSIKSMLQHVGFFRIKKK